MDAERAELEAMAAEETADLELSSEQRRRLLASAAARAEMDAAAAIVPAASDDPEEAEVIDLSSRRARP